MRILNYDLIKDKEFEKSCHRDSDKEREKETAEEDKMVQMQQWAIKQWLIAECESVTQQLDQSLITKTVTFLFIEKRILNSSLLNVS